MCVRKAALALAGLVAALALAWTLRDQRHPPETGAARVHAPLAAPSGEYAGSPSCRACHQREFNAWRNSYHRMMTQAASPAAVFGDFDDVELATQGYQCRLMRDETGYWAELPVEGSRGKPVRKQIVLCTGSHHMQVYWYPTGESGILAQLPFAYLREANQWAPRNAAFLRPPESHPTSEAGRWNHTCIKCHTTGARPGIHDEDIMDARVAELGVACEACHGTGSAHVAANSADGVDANIGNAKMINPADLPHDKSAETCGQCHSVSEFASDEARERWQQQGFSFRPGGQFEAERSIIRGDPAAVRGRNIEYLHIVASAFWRDGMVRVAGREFNGLLKSPCFQLGEMSCLSCHQMHQSEDDPRPAAAWANDQLAAEMDGNRACVQCHARFNTEEAATAHTHHLANSSGSLCYNCHMPHTSYGLMKATRSHQISNPSVAASLATGRPNACNQCHLDKTLEWTAKRLEDWYGIVSPKLARDQRTYAASVLWALQGDAGQRALMAWSFGWPSAQQASRADWMAPLLAVLLDDPYDAVRFMAYRSLRSLGPFQDFDYDFLAAPHERANAIERLLDHWSQAAGAETTPTMGRALLLDVNGDVRRDELDRLLRGRDNQPITLVE